MNPGTNRGEAANLRLVSIHNNLHLLFSQDFYYLLVFKDAFECMLVCKLHCCVWPTKQSHFRCKGDISVAFLYILFPGSAGESITVCILTLTKYTDWPIKSHHLHLTEQRGKRLLLDNYCRSDYRSADRWSDESRCTQFQTDGGIGVRREADDVVHPSCLVATAQPCAGGYDLGVLRSRF